MLLIHGLGDEADTWRHLITPLSADRRVVALDLPGFGRCDKPERPYTIPFFQNIVIELLDTLAIQRAVLIGHSLGAVLAHSVALNYPERVERLILIDGSLVARAQKIDLATMFFLLPGLGEWLYASGVACAVIPRRHIRHLRPTMDDWPSCLRRTARSCSSG